MESLSSTQLFLEVRARLPHVRISKEEYISGDGLWDREKLLIDLEIAEDNRGVRFEPVFDSSALAALTDPHRLCVEMYNAACRIFPERGWRRRDYQTGGIWNRNKLARDLVEKAGMDPSIVAHSRLLDCAHIFSILDSGESQTVLERSDYQYGGQWNRRKLIRDIARAMEPVVDSSYADAMAAAEQYDTGSFVDSSDDDEGDVPLEAEPFYPRCGGRSRSQSRRRLRPRPPRYPPPSYMLRKRRRVSG